MIKAILSAVVVAILGVNAANASEVACVDIQKVVSSSEQVNVLKKEQQAKHKELMTFIEKARKDVAKVEDVEEKQKLAAKYDKEVAEMKQKQDADYASKLKAIEKSISGVVEKQAKLKGYDMVIPKEVILYGTNDITDEIISAMASSKGK